MFFKIRLTAIFLFIFSGLASAQTAISYSLAFPNAIHHEAEITAVFPQVPAGLFSVRMARSSPGRYALHEFAKNIYNVKAYNSAGKELTITRPNLHQWDISGHDGKVTVKYTLFGDRADGTYAAIDGQHVHLNMPATLMYPVGQDNLPRTVTFQIPAGKNWQVATQLKQESTPNTFSAPNFQYLMDSPIEIADLKIREWQVQDQGKTKTIRVAFHTNAADAVLDNYAALAKKVVAEAGAVFGGFPDYDFGSYTFLACYVPQASGDGMEHRNSTYIPTPRPLTMNAAAHLSTLAHEYVHSWNVERIRPKSLEPFNFADANMSGELWFAEGFTNYFGYISLVRSGVNDLNGFAQHISGELNYVLNSPGSAYFSPLEMSYQAPFVDAAQSIDPVNRQNTYISYYPFGSVIGLALDLSLRSKFKNITLDNYMQAVWRKLGQPEKPYTIPDLEQTLAEITKDPAFAEDFFAKHIYGKTLADYKTLLANAGLLLRRQHAGKASLGSDNFSFRTDKAIQTASTDLNSALYKAGLEKDDVLLTLDGKTITTQQSLTDALATRKPGEKVVITFAQRNETKTAEITLLEDPDLELVPYENAGLTPTKQMKAFRDNWLSAKVK